MKEDTRIVVTGLSALLLILIFFVFMSPSAQADTFKLRLGWQSETGIPAEPSTYRYSQMYCAGDSEFMASTILCYQPGYVQVYGNPDYDGNRTDWYKFSYLMEVYDLAGIPSVWPVYGCESMKKEDLLMTGGGELMDMYVIECLEGEPPYLLPRSKPQLRSR